MSVKQAIKTITGSGFLYKLSDPTQVFLEIKTPGYWPIFVGTGYFIGGNWVGPAAQQDIRPRETFAREVRSEISFKRPAVSYDELKVFCPWIQDDDYVAPGGDYQATSDELARLNRIIEAFANAEWFGDFLSHTPQSLIQKGHDTYAGGDLLTLVSAFCAGLSDDLWEDLVSLQTAAGNLSNESQTVILSLSDIITSGFRLGVGYANILRIFFERHGLRNLEQMPVFPEITVTEVDGPFQTYPAYLERYEVEKHP